MASWSTRYKFTGQELEVETGLYYHGARYYNPVTSLWLSVDPLAESYPRRSSYVYAGNNPCTFVDPDGRDEWKLNSDGSYEWAGNSGGDKLDFIGLKNS